MFNGDEIALTSGPGSGKVLAMTGKRQVAINADSN